MAANKSALSTKANRSRQSRLRSWIGWESFLYSIGRVDLIE